MNFEDVILTRKSIRSFSEQEIPVEFLQKMFQAAQTSPSAQNKQCWRFIVLKEYEKRKELALNSGLIGKVNFFIKDAPVIIAACADPSRSVTMNGQEYYLVDTAIAFQQMMLSAWSQGIGSCWLAAFNEKKVKEILCVPDKIRIVALSPFGYPKEKENFYAKTVSFVAKSSKRLDLEKIICFEKWNF